jgi:hypothetical protein
MGEQMVEILHEEEGLLAFSSAGFFGSVWWLQPTAKMVHSVYEARLLHEKKQPGDFVMLTLLKIPKLRSMDSEVRESTRSTRNGLEVNCRADASVLETSAGPIGESITRFAIAAINLMTRAKIPNKLFVDRVEALRWLSSFSRLSIDEMVKRTEAALLTRK